MIALLFVCSAAVVFFTTSAAATTTMTTTTATTTATVTTTTTSTTTTTTTITMTTTAETAGFTMEKIMDIPHKVHEDEIVHSFVTSATMSRFLASAYQLLVVRVWDNMHTLLLVQGEQVDCVVPTNNTTFCPAEYGDDKKNNINKDDIDKRTSTCNKRIDKNGDDADKDKVNKYVESLITTTVDDSSQEIEERIELVEDIALAPVSAAITKTAPSSFRGNSEQKFGEFLLLLQFLSDILALCFSLV